MEAKAPAVFAYVALLLFLTLLLTGAADGASTIPKVVDIQDEMVLVDVSPGSSRTVELTVSVRSPSNRNQVIEIQSDIHGSEGWTAQHPESIYLEPFEEWQFPVYVTAPEGEESGTEVSLLIDVTSETGLVQGSDEASIRVMPHISLEIVNEDPYLVDMPLSFRFRVNLVNIGNARSVVGLKTDPVSEPLLDPGGRIMIGPGDSAFFNIEYDMTGIAREERVLLWPVSGEYAGPSMEILFIPDGDLVHILFEKGPFLVLLPAPTEGPSVKVLSLGGDLTNVGIEGVSLDEGKMVSSAADNDMDALERRTIDIYSEGFREKELIKLRAYGYHEGERITSNAMAVLVQADDDVNAPGPSSAMIYAGGGASAAGMALAGTMAYLYSASEVFRYRWLLFAFIPLYSTVHGEKVLDHFFRGRLFEYIKEHPGVTFTALKDHFEVNNGTLTYHLHRLEREELIVHRNMGKYKLFYAEGVRIRGVEAVISPIDRKIISIITDNPGITSSSVKNMISENRSQRTISRHLKQLERKGFITSERREGKRILFLTGDMERVLIPRKGVMEMRDVQAHDS